MRILLMAERILKGFSYGKLSEAALVIAKRGMGICKKIRVRLMPLENKRLNLAGKGFEIALTEKAYSYFSQLYRVIEMKDTGLTAPCLNST